VIRIPGLDRRNGRAEVRLRIEGGRRRWRHGSPVLATTAKKDVRPRSLLVVGDLADRALHAVGLPVQRSDEPDVLDGRVVLLLETLERQSGVRAVVRVPGLDRRNRPPQVRLSDRRVTGRAVGDRRGRLRRRRAAPELVAAGEKEEGGKQRDETRANGNAIGPQSTFPYSG
jgi:hypothetical protein